MDDVRNWKTIKNVIAFTCLHVIREKRNIRELVNRWNAVVVLVPTKPRVRREDLGWVVEENGVETAGLEDLELDQGALEDRWGKKGASW